MLQATRTLFLSPLIALAITGSAQSQSAGEVLQHMLDTHVERAEGVDNYTLVQEVMGFESEMYFEKETVNGLPLFRLRRSKVGGRVISQLDADDAGWERLYQLVPELTRRAQYAGQSETHGFPVHIVEVTNLEEIEFSPIPDSEEAAFVPRAMTLHVDADQWIVRWAEITGKMTTEGKQHDFTASTDLTDYREVGGMLHPFLVTMEVSGMDEAMGVSNEDMSELRQQIEEMKKQIEQMPEAQQRMMEQMMEQRMAGLEQMLGGAGDGTMKIEIRVTDLRVNSGPPGSE